MQCCSKKSGVIWSFASGIVLIIIGLIVTILIPSVVEHIAVEQAYIGTVIKNGTKVPSSVTERWAQPLYDMRQHVWIYNVTNPDDIMKGGKPKVNEVGPFVFSEKQKKNFTFSEDESRVSYRNNHLYMYNASLSCEKCKLDLLVTVPNPVFQKLVDFAATQTTVIRFLLESILSTAKETAFITVPVREALFDGFRDPLLSKICNNTLLKIFCKNGLIPEKIGFLANQNNTDDGLYEVSTGLKDRMSIGKVFSFNNLTAIPNVWDDPSAGFVNGTDGQLFPPLIQKGDSLHVFAGPMCRMIALDYKDVSEFHDVPAYRFEMPNRLFDTTDPSNKIFCNKNDTPRFFDGSIQPDGCLPPGFIDIGRCLPSAPRIYLSQGHFLGAPTEVWSSVEGIELPNSQHDKTVVDVEKTSGVPIRAKRIMQINMGMRKGNLNVLKNTTNMIMPVLWMNETAWLDEGTRAQLLQLNYALQGSSVIGNIFVCAGGVILVALAAAILIYKVTKEQSLDRHPILQEEEEVAVESAANEED
ncbi:unnamed protein product [Auanema sp. JU1783]|nr:unnamed protein product [Auanema sp. JU1783]